MDLNVYVLEKEIESRLAEARASAAREAVLGSRGLGAWIGRAAARAGSLFRLIEAGAGRSRRSGAATRA